MLDPHSANSELLKSLLEPLLDDFQHWFERSRQLLETENISFLGNREQEHLLERVLSAQQEVRTVQLLLEVTGNQVGVEPSLLGVWHQIVAECWQVAMRFHREKSTEKEM